MRDKSDDIKKSKFTFEIAIRMWVWNKKAQVKVYNRSHELCQQNP